MKLITTLTSMAAFSLLTATSQATIYWDFAQDGNDVKVSVTGSLSSFAVTEFRFSVWTGPIPDSDSMSFGDVVSFGSTSSGDTVINSDYLNPAFVRVGPVFPRSQPIAGVALSGSFISFNGGSDVGDTVFLRWNESHYGPTLDSNDIFNITGVYNNSLLSNFGLTPTMSSYVLYAPKSNPNDLDNSVVMRIAVPEPSTSALSGLGLLFVLARRKRLM